MPNAIRVPSLRLTELDGSPDIQGVERIYLTNGFMSSLGNGAALLSLSGSGGASLTIRDIDGSPSVSNVSSIYLTNGFLSDLGNGSVLLSMSGSAASSAPADATYWVEDANGTLSQEVVVGTTGITTAAYGSRQAAAKAGRLFLPNNGFYMERDTGAAWAPWGPVFPLTPPVDGDFAWVNQGTASVVTTNGGIHMSMTVEATAIHMRVKTAPTPPYTITAWFLSLSDPTGLSNFGLGFRQSSDGKNHNFIIGPTIASQKLDALVFNSNYKFTVITAGGASFLGNLVCLRIADNNTSRILSYSFDGINFITYDTQTRTDFLTANQVSWWGSSNASFNSGVTLLSWKETA